MANLREYCLSSGREELLLQWDGEKNLSLLPEDISEGSDRKVFWKCERGHSWSAAVKSRVYGAGCPYCSGRRVLPGFNDLKTLRPELAEQWNEERNGTLKPTEVSAGARRKVWWRCPKGHEWQAYVFRRSQGSGCPYCAGTISEKSLEEEFPEIAAQWDEERNGGIKPSEVSPGSVNKYWWKCSEGHEWLAKVAKRTREGTGCPYCAGKAVAPGFNDLASRFPKIASEWDEEKNGIPASRVLPGSKKAWWKCPEGHSYSAKINSRTLRGVGCPYCSGKKIVPGHNDLKTLFPAVAAEWNEEKNFPVKPSELAAYSNRKFWWKCSKGHEWQASVAMRTKKANGCPYCAGKAVLPGFNDLKTLEPKIAGQWHSELNGSLGPENVTPGSSMTVWWKCPEGHEWKAPVKRRTVSAAGCPYCSGNVGRKTLEGYERSAELLRSSALLKPLKE